MNANIDTDNISLVGGITPAPWAVHRNSAGVLEVMASNGYGRQTVAHMGLAPDMGYLAGTAKANAQLIAAAPDL
ncbi:hypothetical protein JIN85_01225, partial [Luteolibacter pohnpeiensis]